MIPQLRRERERLDVDAFLDELPSVPAAAHLHACTHTTFSPNLVDGGEMKTNVIPDHVVVDVDIRTLPGEGPEEVDAHLRAALGDQLADCLDDNLDDEIIDSLNEEGIDFDVMTEATADAYAAALTVCQP